jgi:hypothetical protein
MINFIYTIFKDVIKLFSVEPREEKVTLKWFEEYPKRKKLESMGYKFAWSKLEKVKERESEGYKIFIDGSIWKKVKYIAGELILMYKK